ncbi:hypothetical protein K501DRAFT_336871 [Backusella circina FSU 941]|nr:hypothetical protein K501DRAFT_336871 [Backusella circina FSU 941]
MTKIILVENFIQFSNLDYYSKRYNSKCEVQIGYTLQKKCLGTVVCETDDKEDHCRRPKSKKTDSATMKCRVEHTLKHISCDAKVNFCFKYSSNSCTLTHEGIHSHDEYNTTHLTKEQKRKVNAMVIRKANITAIEAVSRLYKDGSMDTPIGDSIDKVLNNRGVTKHFIEQSRKKLSIVPSRDFLGDFADIQKECSNFIISAEVGSSSFSIIFSSPELMEYELPFEKYPVVTDVTYKTVENGYYLCSSVIYVPCLQQHVVIYQAVIGGVDSQFFKRYFEVFFEHYQIDFSKINGFIMDFSPSQARGFIDPFQARKMLHGKSVTEKYDGLQYLKGCFYHWIQSVRRIASSYSDVPPKKSKMFLELALQLRTTTDEDIFQKTISEIETEFPATESWLKW